jgi:hypothetical protein
VSLEHKKKPGPGKSSLTGSSHHDHGASGPGKRTLTEALPHHKSARRDRDRDRDVDRSEGGPSVNVPLVAGRPAKAASAPVPDKDEDKDDARDEIASDDRSDDEAPRARASTATPTPLTIELAVRTYAPVVYMHPDEKFRSADAGEFINNSSLKWGHDKNGKDEAIAGEHAVDHAMLGDGDYIKKGIPSNADARPKDGRPPGGDDGFYLDLNDDNRASRRPGGTAPVYYEAKDHQYITYWFFYAYNEGPLGGPLGGRDDHEGDWERICVKLDSNNRATHVAFYQHNGHKILGWRDVTLEGKTHPVVYSAKGSHASYDKPGNKRLHYKGLPVPVVKDRAEKGTRWVADDPRHPERLRDVTQEDWYGYGGAWGKPGGDAHTTGPQGPSDFKKPAPDGW